MSEAGEIERLWQLADARAKQGDAAGAEAAARQLLALDPLHSGAHLLLGDLAAQRDQHRIATAHAVDAAARMGRQPLQHIAGVTLRLITMGEYERAAAVIARVDPVKVPAPPFLVEFSQQLGLLERHEDALRYLDAAIALGAKAESVMYLRGNCLKFLGRLEEAEAAYERSLKANPDFAYGHWALAYLGTGAEPAARIDRIRRTLANTATGDPDRAYLYYALFKEFDAAGDSDAAWQALAEGARLKRGQLRYDGEAESALFDRLARACPPGFLDGSGDDREGPVPIFVLGLPRTGTTLLERILGGSPEIALCGELNDFRMQFKWASDHHSLGFLDATAIERIPTIDYVELGRRYLDHVAWRAPGSRWFSDKNPGNFMLLGPILRALPRAKILHLQREPMDACFSNLKELFAGNSHAYSYSLTDLAAHHRNYSRLMAHWHAIAPGRILDVRYEDMVSDPDASTRRVMAFLGLPYDPGQIRVESQAAPVSTASSAQVRQPIHRRNVGGWKRYAAQLAPLREMLEGP